MPVLNEIFHFNRAFSDIHGDGAYRLRKAAGGNDRRRTSGS
jgi:hypothetical protein